MPSTLSGKTDSNRWQFDSKTEKDPLLSPGQGTLTNKGASTKYQLSISPIYIALAAPKNG